MSGLFWLAVVILDVYALYNIWTSSEEQIKKLIWTAIVVIAPLLGAIAWYFLGPKAAK